jgi:uncharacterized protein (DUF2345 family)
MSENSTPKKTVRFADEADEPPKYPSPDSTTPPMQKKTVRFALSHEIAPEASSSSPSLQPDASPASPNTLLDTDTALVTPCSNSPFDFSNVSQDSSTTVTGHSTTTKLSPAEILTWSETVSASAPHGLSLPTTNVLHTSPTTPTSIPSKVSTSSASCESALHHSSSGISVFTDAGEKDTEGRVIEASKEPCENRGGRIVWATKGEWLMICEGCKEPQ